MMAQSDFPYAVAVELAVFQTNERFFSVSFSKAVVAVGAVPILILVQQYNAGISRHFCKQRYYHA